MHTLITATVIGVQFDVGPLFLQLLCLGSFCAGAVIAGVWLIVCLGSGISDAIQANKSARKNAKFDQLKDAQFDQLPPYPRH